MFSPIMEKQHEFGLNNKFTNGAPYIYTSVSHSIISPSKMTDDQNSHKMLVDCTHIVDIEFSVDPKDLFHG